MERKYSLNLNLNEIRMLIYLYRHFLSQVPIQHIKPNCSVGTKLGELQAIAEASEDALPKM